MKLRINLVNPIHQVIHETLGKNSRTKRTERIPTHQRTETTVMVITDTIPSHGLRTTLRNVSLRRRKLNTNKTRSPIIKNLPPRIHTRRNKFELTS